jgi:hypothetical protein
MIKRNYELSGFTSELAEKWRKDFREDLKLSIDNESGEIKAKIALSIFEAIRMKKALKIYNFVNKTEFELTRVKYRGKKFRV